MSTKPEKISQREFAKRDGCSPKLVRNAIKDGNLRTLPGGGMDGALVGTGWRRNNRRGGDRVGTVPTEARTVPTGEVPDVAYTVAALVDGMASDAAVILTRHGYILESEAIVAEMLAGARKGAIALLDEDGIVPPIGYPTWSDHPLFTTTVPTRDEWEEALGSSSPRA